MELAALIAALSDPGAYLGQVEAVEVHQTHISVVFLAGRRAYKIKKPVRFGFLDYDTLERRRHFCEEEVRINRRLAPQVYLGVVPVARHGDTIRVEGPGAVVEWAVKMLRLPGEATLRASLERRTVGAEVLDRLARKLAAFHARAERSPAIARSGRLAVVARNARENFAESRGQLGKTVSAAVFGRVEALTEETLQRLGETIEARAARGVPCDTHGDLRLDHVYLLGGDVADGSIAGAEDEDGIVIIDAIEFNDRFRHADPLADAAFLVMDLQSIGRRELAEGFAEAYFRAAGGAEGRALLPFYTAYRAAVRAKVEALKADAPEVSEEQRAAARANARARWLLALGALEVPSRRPCLILVGGLPGSGKSTLSRALAEAAGFTVIRSDVVRKELTAGVSDVSASNGFDQGIYTPEWTDRTYAECLRRAEAGLFEGRRVLIDATFGAECRRRLLIDAAHRWGVPALLLVCEAKEAEIERRLRERRGDASDADWAIYRQAAARWEPLGPLTRPLARIIATDTDNAGARDQALARLRDGGLLGEG